MATLQSMRTYQLVTSSKCPDVRLERRDSYFHHGQTFLTSFLFFILFIALTVIETGELVRMVKMHQLNSGGDPAPMDRVVKSCGYSSLKDENFLMALAHSQIGSPMLETCYYRNKLSLKVTFHGDAYLMACKDAHKRAGYADEN